jgi:photosystem II stability/assembly factor-like uncharacterized protein
MRINKEKSFYAAISCLVATLLLASGVHAAIDTDLLQGLAARTIGPAAVGGRISAIDAVATDPNRIVVGAATGGVWISKSGGLTWEPVFDDEAVASIGAIAINQSNPDIIWVGTGESNVRNSTSIGGGIYKSVDGGQSWSLAGLPDSERIDRIALHPDNPDIVYVAALGTLWGPNEERGVYRTTDGGDSWERILYVDENTGATDIKLDPSNPDRLYAAMWQFRRWPYQFKSGGPGSGIYVSQDGGENWERKTEEDGLPKGELGRTVFAVSPAMPKRLYALVEAKKSALLVSNDAGKSFSAVNEEYNVADRPFYYSELSADPKNADRVYNLATRVRVSIDGGKNFKFDPLIDCCAAGNTVHIDNHAFWINPADPQHMLIGNDGGLAITRDRGATWRFVRNLPLAQFYHVAVDNELPYNVYGGLQDNGSWRGPSQVWESGGIQSLHWKEVGFGDGFDTLPDPENSRRGYVMSQGGFLSRWNLDTGEQRFIRPDPPDKETELRFNWNAGFGQDPFDPATIYYGSQFLHKSSNRGDTWTVISDDLTSNDPELQKFKESGGITYDVTSAENYTSIVSVAPGKLQPGLIWVGTDDGRVHVTRDGGESWNRIDTRARGVAAGSWVPMIAPSRHDAGSAFVVFDDHRRGNMQTYVYRVDNYGQRWTALQTDELSGYALSILQDPVDPGLLFLGTELGLYFSTNGGDNWNRFSAGVPTVSVMDIAIQERETDLVLGTHGRSIFVIDDYRALRGLEEGDFDSRLQILSATPGQQYANNFFRASRFTGSGEFRGENQPYGVLLTFMASGDDLSHPDTELDRERKIRLRESAADTADDDLGNEDLGYDNNGNEDNGNGDKKDKDSPKVKIEVRDAGGELIRSFREPVHQGVNRIAWNMRRDGIRDMPGPDPQDYEDGLPDGPQVPPGNYDITLSLAVGDEDPVQSTVSVQAIVDPRTEYSLADIQANFQSRVTLMGMREAAVSAVERIVHARADVETVKALIKKKDQPDNEQLKELAKRAGEIVKSLNELEKRYRTPPKTKGIVYSADKVTSRIGQASSYLNSTSGAPTATAATYLEIARQSLQEANAAVNDFYVTELASFRADVEATGVGLLSIAAPL